jgi:PAS domain S-box-containing protein
VLRPFSKLTPRLQWSIIFFTLTLLLAAAEGAFIWYVFQDGLHDSVGRSRDLARTVAAKLEILVDDDRQALEKIAERPDIKNFETQSSCDPVFHFFNEFRAQEFERISLLSPEGRLICEPARLSEERQSIIREYEWFKQGMASDGFAVGRVFKTFPAGRMVIPLTHPVKNADGKTIGLLVLTLDLEIARERVFQSLPKLEGLRTLVLDDNGQYILHTDPALIGETPDMSEQPYIALSDTTGRVYATDRKWRLVGLSPVAETKWRVFVGIPEDIALADARQTALFAAAIGIVILLVFALPFIWFGWISVKREESTQQQVDELTELHNFLWSNIPDGAAFFNEDGFILDANEQLVTMLGRNRAEIIRHRLNEFTPTARADERAKVRRDGFNTWATTFQRPDGTHIDVETKVQSFAAGERKLYVGVFRDYTKLRAAEERLKQSEELLAQTERVAAIGGWEYDVRTDTARWTTQTKRIHEVNDDYEVTRATTLKFFPPEVQPRLSAAFTKCLESGTPYDLTLPFITRKGRALWVRTLGRALVENGKTVRIVGTLQDITTQKTAELALEDARAKAEIASKAKSSFIAVMSHEIRTPLTGILGMADLLLTEQLSPHQKSLVERLLRSGRVLLDLINDVLDFSKIEANKLSLDCVPFNPADIFQSVRELLEPIAAEKGLELRFDVDDSLSQCMLGDPKRLRQVLVNLAGNAIKFTTQGSVTVSADSHQDDRGTFVLYVSVIDTGVGISATDQQNLFKPYVQAESGPSTRSLGTGLGLSICKLLVEAMGGEISVVSSEGRGSTFTFSLRLHPDRGSIGALQRNTQNTATLAFRPLRILAAEDNETSRYLIQSMLARKGHKVVVVENGALAVDAVQTQEFDIILMDMQMPVMDGKDAVRAIRKLGIKYASMPIIALTADMVDENRTTYFDAGIDSLVGKPVDWDVLEAEMSMLVRNRAGDVNAGSTTTPVLPSPSTDTPPQDIDHNALQAVADLLGAEKFNALLGSFRENMTKYQKDIHAHVANDDLKQARRTAHSLKGLALQFGATTVGQMASRMEVDAMGIAEIKAQLPTFDEKIAQALTALSKPDLLHSLSNKNA